MMYGLLTGTSQVMTTVRFTSMHDYAVCQRIAREFGFLIQKVETPYRPPEDLKVFEYPHDFRAFCCHERYDTLGGFTQNRD